MIDIVCAHDAKNIAEKLTRLLEAQQHRVRLTYGRQAMSVLNEARQERSIVLLIWSANARSQTYMIEWANKIEPWRLAEIALTPDLQRTSRKATIIDFEKWKGERGGRAWDALHDRLSAIERTLNPPKPVSKPAIAAMLMLTIAAVFGAVSERNKVAHHDARVEPTPTETVVASNGTERGGPMISVEPGDLNEVHFRRIPEAVLLDAPPDYNLTPIADEPLPTIRNETLIEQLSGTLNSGLNLLRTRPSTETAEATPADTPPQ